MLHHQVPLLSMAGPAHGSAGSWFFVVIALFITGAAITLAINPKLQWKMNRWQFKNPQALEPSNAALVMTRIVACVISVVAVVFVVIGIRQL